MIYLVSQTASMWALELEWGLLLRLDQGLGQILLSYNISLCFCFSKKSQNITDMNQRPQTCFLQQWSFDRGYWDSCLQHSHTHGNNTYTPACKRLQMRTIGMDLPTEDTRFLIHHYSTVDIMWLFTTQPRTSSYTPNRGHGLNSIFTSFPSSCTPRGPSTVWNVSSVFCEISGVCPRLAVLPYSNASVYLHKSLVHFEAFKTCLKFHRWQ